MRPEIERKFLIRSDFRPWVHKSTRLVQGYLSSVPERSVRVRMAGDHGTLTIKGIGNSSGAVRFEWETTITVHEAAELMKLCEPGVIEKTRHLVTVEGHTFEVDEFHGANHGLFVAELELTAEDAPYPRPEWLGEEVTHDQRYYNSMLVRRPYATWGLE